MYEYLIERMNNSDLHQYEISNFGKVGHESEHNKVYWKTKDIMVLVQAQVVMLMVNVTVMLTL